MDASLGLSSLTKRLVTEIRNQTLVDVYYALKDKRGVTQEDLAGIYGISRERIAQLISQRNSK